MTWWLPMAASGRRAVLYYDRRTVVNEPYQGMCWRCLSFDLIQRTIRAYLLHGDGVDTRTVRWVQCATCGKQFKAESED